MIWIALDFGTNRLKALRFALEPQKLTILDFHAWESKPEYFKGLGFPEAPAWAAATIQLNELDWLKLDEDTTITTALPSSYLEARYLKFPFRNEKQIEKVLPFEMESTVPFDIEELLIRHHLLEGDGMAPKRKDSLVLALAYKRELVKRFEDEIRKFQNVIPPLTAQALTLTSLRQAIQDPVFGLLEIGHNKTQFILLQKTGRVLGARTFWWGGASLIGKVAEFLSVDYTKALAVMTAAEPPEVPIRQASFPFITEFRQTLKGMQMAGLQWPQGLPVYVFGMPSQSAQTLKMIEEGVKSDFGVDIRRFPYDALASRSVTGLENLENLDLAMPLLSVAMAQLRTHRGRIPIFSESGFQFQQNLKKLKTGSFTLLRRVAMLLIVPLIYLIVQYVVQGRENQEVMKQVAQTLRSAGVEMGPDDSTSSIVDKLKKELASNRRKIEQLSEDGESPLTVLTQISRLIPNHIKIDVKELKISPEKVLISAETTDDAGANQITDILKNHYPQAKVGATAPCSVKKDCRLFTVELDRKKEG